MGRVLPLLLMLLLFLMPACRVQPDAATAPATSPEATGAADMPLADAAATRAPKPTRPAGDPAETPATEPTAASGWTLMFYLNAAGDAADEAEQVLAAVEAGAPVDGVNLLVQVADDQGAIRRFRVGAEAEDGAPVRADMGGADGLADFVAWARQNYPARHDALILWDPYGGGWEGLALHGDEAVLSPADLTEALAGVPPLDLVVLDAGRMTHLELLQALQPHARFAVAPAGTAATGQAYADVLARLDSEADIGPQALAREIAASFRDATGAPAAGRPAPVAVVDLGRLPAVTAALDLLAAALAREPAVTAPAVAAARAAAEQNTPLAEIGVAAPTAVDLGQFARQLAGRSPDPAVAGRARALAAAVGAALVDPAADGAAGQQAGELLLHFPPRASAYRVAYGELPQLGGWQQFLSAYHALGLAGGTTGVLEIVRTAGEVADVAQPAYLDYELAARNVHSVAAVAGRREADGRLRLLGYVPLQPPAGPDHLHWPDGVHEGHYVWDTLGRYLSDGSGGGFVPTWPVSGDGDLAAVTGLFRAAGADRRQAATLLIDSQSGEPVGLWAYRGEASVGGARLYQPAPGDLFEPFDLYLDAQTAVAEAGDLSLTWPVTGSLRLETRPLPQGDYELGVVAEMNGAPALASFVSLTVNNQTEAVATRSYLDPVHGFQFLYPFTWTVSFAAEDPLRALAPDGDTMLTVTAYPGVPPGSARLQEETLDRFGAVDLLYEETAVVDGETARVVVYGYEAPAGGRTGTFFTFVHAGTGYVVDVDGPADREQETLALARRVRESWLFRTLDDNSLGRWQQPAQAGLPGAVPAGYRYESLANGWDRFSHDGAFIAFRHEPATAAPLAEAVNRWLAVAGDGVEAFDPQRSLALALGADRWQRADFGYERASTAIRGFVMVTVRGEEEVVVWVEAPSARFASLEEGLFLPLAAEVVSAKPGTPGLRYAARFTPDAAWGSGSQAGAEGAVRDGAYRLAVTADEGVFWATAGRDFGPATYVLTATQTAGPLDNGYGLVLRADGEAGAFYLLEISGDGYVWVGRCHEGCARRVTLAGEGWFPSPAVHTGLDAPNQLRVEADEAHLTFFVNEQQVAQVADARLARGDVGFLVETLGEGGLTVSFSDLRVYLH